MYTAIYIYTGENEKRYEMKVREAKDYKKSTKKLCEEYLEQDPLCNPVIITLPKAPQSQREFEIIEEEVNKRYLDIARTKEFLNSLLPPFNEPYNLSQDF